MRRFLFTLIVMGMALFNPWRLQNAQADDMWDKGGRGFANVITSPEEILRQGMIDFGKKGGLGIFTGGFRGFGTMFQRLGVGVYEMVTFPFPGSTEYKAILEPEYIIPSTNRTHANRRARSDLHPN